MESKRTGNNENKESKKPAIVQPLPAELEHGIFNRVLVNYEFEVNLQFVLFGVRVRAGWGERPMFYVVDYCCGNEADNAGLYLSLTYNAVIKKHNYDPFPVGKFWQPMNEKKPLWNDPILKPKIFDWFKLDSELYDVPHSSKIRELRNKHFAHKWGGENAP